MCEKPDTADGAASGADTQPIPVPPLKEPCAETEKDSEEVIPDVPSAPII